MKSLHFIFVLLFFFSCNGQEKKEHFFSKDYTYKTNKRTIYGFDLTVPGAYELYINDIAARKDYSGGMHNTFIEINPYVLKSGTYGFKLKVFPEPSDIAKGGIQPSTVEFLQVALASYEKIGDKRQAESYKVNKQFPVDKIEVPVPYYEVTGEFTVELPYELEGWSNGQNLSRFDQKELMSKVVAFYEKAKNIMNNGDVDNWLKLTQIRTNETFIFNYTTITNQKEFQILNSNTIKNENKNNMLEVSDYSMYLYANGKIVTLERNATTHFEGYDANIKGWSPLIRNDNGLLTASQILLYLPQDSNEFVIIRK